MRAENFIAVVKDIQYKPYSRIQVAHSHVYGAALEMRITLKVIDVHTNKLIDITSTEIVQPDRFHAKEEVVHFVRQQIHRMEMHEADEWIKVNGVAIFDPHKEKTA